MDKFDKKIKDALSNYEAPYDASHWTSLNKKMGAPKSRLYKWIGGTAALLTIVVLGYYYVNNQSTKNMQIANHLKKDEVTTVNNTTKEQPQITNKVNDVIKNDNVHSTNHSNENNNINQVDTENNPAINDNEVNKIENNNNSNNNPNIEVDGQPNVNYPTNSIESVTEKQAKAEFVVDNYTKCLNESFEIRPSVPKQKAIYQWDLGDGTIVNANYITHSYNKPGTYQITLTLKDLKTQEVIKKSEPVEVSVYNVPQANFTYEFSNGVMPLVAFKNNTDDVTSKWEIVGVATSNSQNFEYTFKHKGEYVVKLITTNDNGCQSTATQVVKIDKDYNLLAPNAFSPNGDNLNDYFIPKALPLLNLPFTMLVYDRQGSLMYETKDANKPWDGINFRDGVPASDGVYVWIVQLKNEKGEIETYQGQITITR